jgi:uncharacterized cupredoxin-like copper-binding protein
MRSPTPPRGLQMLAGAAALVTLGVACGSAQATTQSNQGQPSQQAAATPAAAAYPSKITVLANEYLYAPNHIDLKAGQPVTLTIVNGGKVDHDMKSEIPLTGLSYTKSDNEPGEQADNAAKNVYDVDFNVGTTAVITFTPTTAGSFPFRCDQPGHTEAGMTGVFVVH